MVGGGPKASSCNYKFLEKKEKEGMHVCLLLKQTSLQSFQNLQRTDLTLSTLT